MTSENRDAFERDLEAVISFMADPPAAGSPEDQHLHRLIDRIEQYRPEPEDMADFDARIARVTADVEAFRRRRQVDRQRNAFLEGGQGFGPTLGMDLRKS